VDVHRQVRAKNLRTIMMVKIWEHLKPEVRKGHWEAAATEGSGKIHETFREADRHSHHELR